MLRRRILFLASLAQLRAAPSSGLEVVVTDPSQAPVQGATVILLRHDRANESPARGASDFEVTLSGKKEVALIGKTDANGKFHLGVGKGSHITIEVRAVGCRPWTRSMVTSDEKSVQAALVIGPTVMY